MNDSHNKVYSRKESIRLRGFDYSWPRIYFVTIVAQGRQAKFLDERVATATVESLRKLRKLFQFNVYIYCLMPDHFHGLIGPGESGRTLGGLCGAHSRVFQLAITGIGTMANFGSGSSLITLFAIIRTLKRLWNTFE